MITADNITDEQLRNLADLATVEDLSPFAGEDTVSVLVNICLGMADLSDADRQVCRARCAEILEARRKEGNAPQCAHALVEVLSTNGRNLDGAQRRCAHCSAVLP